MSQEQVLTTYYRVSAPAVNDKFQNLGRVRTKEMFEDFPTPYLGLGIHSRPQLVPGISKDVPYSIQDTDSLM